VVTTAIDLYAPDFSTSTKTVTNLAGRDPAEPGDVLEYALTFTNTGQDPAAGSVTTDPIPAGTRFVPGSLTITDGPGAGPQTDAAGDDRAEFLTGDSAVRFRLGDGAGATSGGTIGPGASTRVTFQVEVTDAGAGTTVTNAAPLDYVAQTLQQPFVYTLPVAEIPVLRLADLSISKTSSPDPASAGDLLTSTLTIANAGPSAAADVVVTDQLPDGVTFVGADTPQGSCSEDDGLVRCALGTVPVGQPIVVEVRTRLAADLEDPSSANTAFVSSPTADRILENNAAGSSVAVTTEADLSVTKSVTDDELRPGQRTTFRVVVRNDGPSVARSVTVSDKLDPGLTAVTASLPGAGCETTASDVRCILPQLPVGESRTMTVTADVSSAIGADQALANTATAVSETSDPDSTDNSDTLTVRTLAPLADLAVTKRATPATNAGGTVEYVVEVTNRGPSTAAAVTLDDVLPAGLIAQNVSTTLGTCTGTTTVSCEFGDLAPPQDGESITAVVTIVAEVPPDAQPGSITNEATADSATADADDSDNSASDTTRIDIISDLAVTKTANPIQPSAGDNVTYTVTVSNAGPSASRDVVLTEDLPDEFEFVSVTAPAGVSCEQGDPLTCSVGSLPVGAERQVTVVMHIPSGQDLSEGIANTATVDGAGDDPAPANDEATAIITTGAISDLLALKFLNTPPEPEPLTAGQQVTYQVAVGNLGPSDASTARLVDELPAGVTFVSSVPECSYVAADHTVVCDLPSVPNQFAAVFPVTVRVNADVDEGTLLTNTATVTLTDPSRVDPVSSNNSAVVSRGVTTAADLVVEKTGFHLDLPSFTTVEPAATPPGGILAFGIDVRNDGPSVARDVVVSDTLNLSDFVVTQIRLVRSDGSVEDVTAACSVTGEDFQCGLGDLPPFTSGQASWRLQIDGVVLSNALGGIYVNEVTVSSTTAETSTANNTDEVPVTVLPSVATLSVQKTADEDSFVAGSTFSYLIEVANILDLQREGASDAPEVVIDDQLPAGLTATSVSTTQGECTTDGGSIVCRLGTVLGPGRLEEPPPVQIRVFGTVAGDATGPVTNVARASSLISDPAFGQVTVPIVRQADLSIVKQADSETTPAGAAVGYTLVVTNAGPSTAADVVIEDAVPAQLTVDEAGTDPSCLPVRTPLVCNLGSIASGEARSVRIVGNLDPGQSPGTIVNTARIAPRTDDPDSTNNSAQIETTVSRSADLSVVKQADHDNVAVGSPLIYQLTVSNAGPSTATEVELSDELPAGLSLVSIDADPGLTCSEQTGAVSCTATALAPGEALVARFAVTVDSGLEPGNVVNTVVVSSGVADPEASNDSATATVGVFALADTSIVKSVVTANPTAGDPVTFALDVTNNGPQDAPAVVLSDTLPTSVTFISAEVADGPACTLTNPEGVDIVTCLVGRLAVGETARALVTVLPGAGVSGFENVAVAGSGALDERIEDNLASVTVELRAGPGSPSPTPTDPGTGTPRPAPDPVDPPNSELPQTGAPDRYAWLLAGLLLAAGGAVLVRLSRRSAPQRRMD